MDLSLDFNFCKFFIKILFFEQTFEFWSSVCDCCGLSQCHLETFQKAQGGIGFLTHFGGRQSFYTFTIVDNLNMLD